MPSKLYFPQLINHLIKVAAEKVASRANMGIANLHEPDITSALVTELPDMVNRVMQSAHVRVSFGGCYIHQKPKVYFPVQGDRVACREIGDLLVVCRQEYNGVEAFSATLFQMKNHDVGIANHVIKHNELEQLYLYKYWPNLYFKKEIEPTYFDVYPKSFHQGAQYGLIRRDYPHDPITIYHSLPSSVMSIYPEQTFGDFIQDLVLCQKGRIITSYADRAKDEWSRLMWYLIDICRASNFKLTRVNYPKQPRVNGEFFDICNMMVYGLNPYVENDIHDVTENENESDGNGCFALLLINTEDDHLFSVPRYKDYLPFFNGKFFE